MEIRTDKVKIIDVRTPEEFAFVGHPGMAWNISPCLCAYSGKGRKNRVRFEMNPILSRGQKK